MIYIIYFILLYGIFGGGAESRNKPNPNRSELEEHVLWTTSGTHPSLGPMKMTGSSFPCVWSCGQKRTEANAVITRKAGKVELREAFPCLILKCPRCPSAQTNLLGRGQFSLHQMIRMHLVLVAWVWTGRWVVSVRTRIGEFPDHSDIKTPLKIFWVGSKKCSLFRIFASIFGSYCLLVGANLAKPFWILFFDFKLQSHLLPPEVVRSPSSTKSVASDVDSLRGSKVTVCNFLSVLVFFFSEKILSPGNCYPRTSVPTEVSSWKSHSLCAFIC